MLSAGDTLEAAQRFLRGDSNADGVLNITDAIHSLGFLFLGSPAQIPCEDAADSNDDGKVNISDPVHTLGFLFLGTPAPPAPFGAAPSDCGEDLTADALGCESFAPCPTPPVPPAPPVLEPPLSPTREATIDLHGTALAGLTVKVTGGLSPVPVEAVAAPDGKFAMRVELITNRRNRLFAVAEDASGRASPPAAVEVIQDSGPPFVYVDEPADGSTVIAERVTVTGRVSDMLSGFMGLSVTVNGEPAQIAIGIGTNGTFERQDVPLGLDANTLLVAALDAAGNSKELVISVERVPPPADAARLVLVSGNGQKRPIHATLPEPIVVEAVAPDGTSPLEGKIVTFHVTRSDGRLSSRRDTLPDDRVMTLAARTGADGLAAAYWTLGSDAGCGNNRLRVTGDGLAGDVVFCASATPGPAAQINIGSGNNQRGEAGAPLAEALKAWVSDGCNGIAGVPVTFRVVQGSGKVEGLESITVPTSPTGHAQVSFVLGPEPGNHRVEAQFDGNATAPAVFTAYALVRDEARPTTFTGLVLDNSQQPIGGAVVILEVPGFEGVQDATELNGSFRLEAPAAGPASLRVEGSSAKHLGGEGGQDIPPGSNLFPSLTYEVVLVPNAENSLAAPVLLPPLDPENAVDYDGSSDVVLRVKGVEGLEMRVPAGTTVTLRDGTQAAPGRPVRLSLNQVHHDDVPMPMPDGAAPPFAWTLQPARATFDPPLRVKYPNMSGLPAGAVAYFLTFNHDTGRFEIFASGHVNAEGSWIETDPGTGIRVAGWGCNCPPYAVTGGSCYLTILGPKEVAENDTIRLVAAPLAPGSFTWSASSGGTNVGLLNTSGESVCILGRQVGASTIEVQFTSSAPGGGTCTASYDITIVRQRPAVVVIDPGHGGSDNGNPGPSWSSPVPEKQINLEVANLVKGSLESLVPDRQRLRVVPTRKIDKWVSLNQRPKTAVTEDANIFLSIHFNSLVVPCDISRTETYVWPENDPRKVCLGVRNVNYDGDYDLALTIQGAVVSALRSPDNGVLPMCERVIRDDLLGNTRSLVCGMSSRSVRSCLVEIDFWCNQAVYNLFVTDPNRVQLKRNLATSIADAIIGDLELHGDLPVSLLATPNQLRGTIEENREEFPPGIFLDESWQFTVNGKTVSAETNGSFIIANIVAADAFGPAGPGSIPDFLSDDFMRVTGVSTQGGATLYAFSPKPFQIRQGETYSVPELTITPSPPPLPRSLRIESDRSVIRVGESIQLKVTGTLGDGTEADLTPRAAWTVYRTTNPAVASVGKDGLVTAHGSGTVYITAVNEGATAVKRIDAAKNTVTVRITGVARLPDGTAANGAKVRTGFGGEAIADTDGTFTLEVEVPVGAVLSVAIGYVAGAERFSGMVKIEASEDMVEVALGTITLVHASTDLFPGRRSEVSVGVPLRSLAFGDLDGDGDVDLAVASNAAGSVSVLKNQGNGLFELQGPYGVGLFSESLVLGDLDGDGDADLAVANSGSNSVAVLKNQGSGVLDPQIMYLVGHNPVSVALGDLDGDGDTDLAVANSDFICQCVSILRNQGDGTFADQVQYGAGSGLLSVAVGDLDGDGHPDLAVANSDWDTVSVLSNAGDGTFADQKQYNVGDRPDALSMGDFDGDGDVDLAVANWSSNTISILRNEREGTFAVEGGYSVGMYPTSISMGDLDGDGAADLAVANSLSDNLSVLKNRGDGTFEEAIFYPVGDGPFSVIVGDLDGDGDADLAVAHGTSNNVLLLWNPGDGAFVGHVAYGVGSRPPSVTVGDLDGDGDTDLAVPNDGSGTVVVLRNRGDGTFEAHVDYGAGARPQSVAVGNLDGEGHPDLAVANYDSNDVSVLLNQGEGTFAPQKSYLVGKQPQSVALGDLDADGDADLAVANYDSDSVSVLLNQGDGTFAADVPQYNVRDDGPVSVALGDLDGDGDTDLAVASIGSRTVSVLRNQRNGTFATAVLYQTGESPHGVAAGDLDGDGDADLVVAGYKSDTVSVLLNNGNGTFAGHIEYRVPRAPYSIALSDLDGDGDADIAVGYGTFSPVFSVLLNLGDGSFAAHVEYRVEAGPTSVALGDLDGDGDADVAVANQSSDTVSVLLNQTSP